MTILAALFSLTVDKNGLDYSTAIADSAYGACQEIDGTGPYSQATLNCILDAEIGTLDRDDGPGTPVKPGYQKALENTVKTLVCRNNFNELPPGSVACCCETGPGNDPPWERDRIENDFDREIQKETEKQANMTQAEKEAHCKDWFFWYHFTNPDDPSFTGYMTPELKRKTDIRHKNRPKDGRVIKTYDNLHGRDIEIYFPHPDDVPGREYDF